LERVLEDLRSLSGEIDAGFVLSEDGRMLASTWKAGSEIDQERLAAMLSALSVLAENTARRSGKGHASQARVQTEEGYVLVTRLVGGGALAATAGPDARAGLLLYDLRNARAEVERIVGEGSQR
jgi:predicted regulator of Ras-like GTPase activity (Roadblock/LC7/MglB family)